MSSHTSSSSVSLTQIYSWSTLDLSTSALGCVLFQLSYPSAAALLSNLFLHCPPSSWPKAALTFFIGMWFLKDVIKVVWFSCLYNTHLLAGKIHNRAEESIPYLFSVNRPFDVSLQRTEQALVPILSPIPSPILSQDCKSLWRHGCYQHKPGVKFYFYLWLSHLPKSLCLLNNMANITDTAKAKKTWPRISLRGF